MFEPVVAESLKRGAGNPIVVASAVVSKNRDRDHVGACVGVLYADPLLCLVAFVKGRKKTRYLVVPTTYVPS
jgi:hypothetical protein